MEWYYWVIILILTLTIFQFLSSYFGFRYIILKKNQSKNLNERDLTNTQFAKYEQKINECFEFIKNLKKEEIFIISQDKLKLHGTYIDNKSDKVVIMVHGFRSTALNDFSWSIKRFYEEGYNILYIDQRCHGLSEGKYISFGIKERIDVLDWINYINERSKPKDIILYGISMGCASVQMALALNIPKNVKVAILDCGYKNPFKLLVKKAKETIKINAFMTVLFMDVYCRLLGGFSLLADSSEKALKKVTIPCLFIHGKSDSLVPFSDGVANYNACISKDKEAVFVDDVEHAMCYYEQYPQLEEKIIDYIEKAINKECD